MENENNDLYKILELTKDATLTEIKTNFKKLAKLYHPDKNKEKNATEKFNKIRIAYETLSDPEKKKKYDNWTIPKKIHFTETIILFLKEITNPKTIQNLMNRPDIIQDIKNGNIAEISQKLIQKILDNIDDNIDISELTKIFIHNQNQQEPLLNIVFNKQKNSSDSVEPNCDPYQTSDFNTLNIFGNVKTNLNDIYHNKLKEIFIKRKISDGTNTEYENLTFYVPLYDQKVIISGAGEKIIETLSNQQKHEKVGDVILTIYCKKDKSKRIQRDDYDIIYNDTITLYELFNGFKKTISYFGSELNICSTNPFKEYNFDGDKISIHVKNKGLPCDQKGNRGNLILNLYLIKQPNFDEILEKNFS